MRSALLHELRARRLYKTPPRSFHLGRPNAPLSASATVASAASSLTADEAASEVEKCYRRLDLSFENGQEAFKVRRDEEKKRFAKIVFFF